MTLLKKIKEKCMTILFLFCFINFLSANEALQNKTPTRTEKKSEIEAIKIDVQIKQASHWEKKSEIEAIKIDSITSKENIVEDSIKKEKKLMEKCFFATTYGKQGNPSKLSPKKLFPQGRKFLYSGYSGKSEEDLKNGFSVAGPFYGGQKEIIEKCQNLNIPVVAHIGFTINGQHANATSALEAAGKLSEEEVKELINEQLNNLNFSDENIVMWGMIPEEVRPWKKGELQYLEKISKAIHEADPLKRPTYMYHPNNRDVKTLKIMAPFCDYLGKGSYINPIGFKEHRAQVRWNVEQCLKALPEDSNQVVIVQPWMAKDPEDPEEDKLIESWVRHDVYLGLVAGARGVMIWSLFNRRKGFERTWQQYYDAYAKCGQELTGEDLKLGDVFMFGDSKNDLNIFPIETRFSYSANDRKNVNFESNTSLPDEGKNALLHPWTSAEIAYKNGRYVFIVNSWKEPTTFIIQNIPKNGKTFSVWTKKVISEESEIKLTLQPWEVVALKIQKK